MPAPTNKMTALLNKLERRLGTKPLGLPDELNKNAWANEVIANETLDTFSRYFPNTMTLEVGRDMKKKGNEGWYVIDQHITDGVEILGVRDVDWQTFSRDSIAQQLAGGYGLYSALPTDYNVDDVMMIQARANLTSIFNNPIICEYKAPNMIRLSGVYKNDVTHGLKGFPVTVFIKHATNLMTIAPTKMEVFEELAECDVASFLYENLKYYEGLETPTATMDMKLSELESKAGKRDDVISKLEDGRISFANDGQPMIMCV
jgi:hypothetical protein